MSDNPKVVLERPLVRYAMAVGATAASFLLRYMIIRQFGVTLPPYITFFPAIMLVAVFAGLWPGVLATGLTALGVDYLILPPTGRFAIENQSDAVALGIFTLMSIFMSLLAERYRRARSSIEAYKLELANRRNEEELRNATEFRQLALDAADLGTWEFHPESGGVSVDRNCLKLFGFLPGEAYTNDQLPERIHPEDRGNVNDTISGAIAGADDGLWGMEYRVVWPDGSIHWLSSHGQAYFSGEGGHRRALRLIGVNMDITARKHADSVLQESEAKYRSLFESASDGILVSDGEGKILDANATACLMLGCTRRELQSMVTRDLVAGDDLKRIALETERVISGLIQRSNWQCLRKDGTTFPCEASATLLPDGHLLGILRDVTERQKLQEAVRESEAHLAMAQARAHLGSWELDLETGKGTWSAEMSGLYYRDHSAPAPSFEEYLEMVHAQDRQVIADQKGHMSEIRDVVQFDNRTNPSLGEMRHLSNTIYLTRDAAGRPIKLSGTSLDVTERVAAENALHRTTSQLQIFIEHAPAALAMFDTEMRYLFASRRWLADYGLQDLNLRGQAHYEVFPEVTERWKEAHRRCLAGEVLRSEADCFQRADGTSQWLAWEIRPWQDASGAIGGIVVFTEDITVRKQAENTIRESEHLYRNLFNSMEEGFCVIEMIFDPEGRPVDYRFIEINKSYESQTGISNPVGKRMREIAPNLEDYWFEFYGKVALTGEPAHLVSEAKAIDGYYDVRAYRVGQPELRRVAVVFNEISERMREEKALREQAELISLAHDTIMVWDLNGTIRFWNHGAEEMYGFSKLQAQGRIPYQLLGTVFPQPQSEIEALLLQEGHWEGELTHTTQDGVKIVVASRWALQSDKDGRPTGVMEINNDITERRRAEEAQTAYRTKLDVALASMTDAVFISDETGKIIQSNKAFAKFFRLENTSTPPGTLSELLDVIEVSTAEGVLVPGDQLAVPRALRGETVTDAEYRVRRKDTGEAWVGSCSFSPLRDSLGSIFGAVVVIRDITDRKRAEEHIRQLIRVYAVLSDINQTIVREKHSQAMLEAACRIAVDKGHFRMAWVGMIDRHEKCIKPIASSGWVDGYLDTLRIDVRDPDAAHGPVARCFTSGKHAVCEDTEHDPLYLPWRSEALQRGYRSSGSFPLAIDGRVIGVFCLYADEPGFFVDDEIVLLDEMAMDISHALEVNRHEEERRKAEEELRWRTAFFEAQVDSALDGVLVVNSQGRKILQNQRLNQIFKIPAHVSENTDDAQQVEFVTGLVKNPVEFAAKVKYLVSHPDQVSRDEVELLDSTILDRYSAPVKDLAGDYYGRIWTFRDITDRRHLEEQLRQAQKMEAVGQLTGGIAHDFNNLLTVIMGCAEFIGRELNENPRLSKMAGMILSAAKRGSDMTHRMLAFARRQTLQPQSVDVHRLVIDIKSFLRRTLSEGIEFDVIHGTEPCIAIVDPTELENALLNLCVNARDAMPSGGHLSIEVANKFLDSDYAAQNPGTKPGHYVLVTVSDTGSGISPEILERVFDPFFTTKEVGKGTGLGLSMVYGFAKQSEGHVKIYSEVGYGTSVKLYLPYSTERTEPSNESPQPVGDVKCSEVILLVEDDLHVLEIAKAHLISFGYRVHEAMNGKDALKILRERMDIDLLLTDIVMPGGLNGPELAIEARRLHPGLKVMYCSGYAESAVIGHALLDRGAQLLNKPYSRSELSMGVRSALAAN